jgi:hypothetical protein
MKKIKVLLMIFILIFVYKANAQDTLIINNNYKWKIGGKFMHEKSSLSYNFVKTYNVNNFGVQIIRRTNNQKLFWESGIYKITRAMNEFYRITFINQYPTNFSSPSYYHHLNIPFNILYDTRVLYVSGGPYIEFLLQSTSEIKRFHSHEFEIMKLEPVYKRKFHVGLNLNAGVEKIINSHLNLFIEGRISQNLLSNNYGSSSYSRTKFINAGIGIGINYKFLN